jgi:hypothetical protein
MKARNTQKMGIKKVNEKKVRADYVKGPLCSGKVTAVDFGGGSINPAYRNKDGFYRSIGTGSECMGEKADDPYPEADKVKVNADPRRQKGNSFVQRMIHRSNGYAAGPQRGSVLAEEKMIELVADAVYSCLS